jgi:hypothetical protein
MAGTAGASSSILEGAEPPSKKTHSKAYLLVSSRYVCVEPSAADVTFLLLSSFLSSKTVIFGRQEAYLGSSECSSAGCAPDISPTPDFGGVDTRGDSMGGTDRGVSAGGAIVGNDDEGTGAGSADVGRERFSPYLGCPRSG